jgi:hypothetical protein
MREEPGESGDGNEDSFVGHGREAVKRVVLQLWNRRQLDAIVV